MGTVLLGAMQFLLATQATQATIGGSVRDEQSGAVLAGAEVVLTDLNQATLTDADGRYLMRRVPAGAQHITVRFLGHAPRTLHALVPPSGHIEINVSLRSVAFRLSSVKIRPPVAVRGFATGDSMTFADRTSSIAAVRNHPMLAEPDVLQALGGGEVVLKPESPSGIHIRGGSSDQTAYVLDGIPVFSPYHTGASFSAWNPDALSSVSLSSDVPSPMHPASLSGTVAGTTRNPEKRLNVQGGATTSQARLTVDGPVGTADAGYMISFRSGFPGLAGSKHEASHLSGTSSDFLATLGSRLFGGRLRLLGYDSQNEISTAATANADPPATGDALRNAFEWHSQSVGAEWRGNAAGMPVRVLGWSAVGDAGADWGAESGRIGMAAERRDEGLLLSLERASTRSTTVAGMRLERSRTSYRIELDSAPALNSILNATTPVVSLFAQQTRDLGRQFHLQWAASAAAAAGDLHIAPRGRLQWKPSERLALSGSYARLHQFAQSLRNAESVVGNVFPVDLHIGAAAPGVPVAHSDQVVVAGEYRPSAGVRLGAQGYSRRLDGLLLVAPVEGKPFATRDFSVGSGAARGFSVDATMSTARYGIVASYGLQRARVDDDDSSYVPDHGATHLVEAGIIVLPTATSSARLGITGALGRRTTGISGGLEWEACNLRDRGCEFGGSPEHRGQSLGGTRLPAYMRIDLGVRKHWHFDIQGRDATVAVFGTMTNLLNRKNLLTYAPDTTTGELVGIEMRPQAPLVVGLDWRF